MGPRDWMPPPRATLPTPTTPMATTARGPLMPRLSSPTPTTPLPTLEFPSAPPLDWMPSPRDLMPLPRATLPTLMATTVLTSVKCLGLKGHFIYWKYLLHH